MVVPTLILVFTSLGYLETLEYSKNTQYDLIESWGIKRVFGRDEIKSKFESSGPEITCDELHKTKDAPFLATVLYRTSGRLLCLGSIIDPRHILTAKRCYEKVEAADLRVLVGCYKAYWAKYSQVKGVSRIIRHEYEVAILKLKEMLNFTDYIKAVKLPQSITAMITEFEKPFPPPYKVAGFLVDRYDVPGDYISKEKTYQILEDSLVEFGPCQANFSKLILIPEVLFCTIGNATFCWGGWGAPVLKETALTENFVQVGVVIADNCTASSTGPLLAARIDSISDWIRGIAFQGHQPK